MDLRVNGLALVANSGDTQGMEGQMQKKPVAAPFLPIMCTNSSCELPTTSREATEQGDLATCPKFLWPMWQPSQTSRPASSLLYASLRPKEPAERVPSRALSAYKDDREPFVSFTVRTVPSVGLNPQGSPALSLPHSLPKAWPLSSSLHGPALCSPMIFKLYIGWGKA